MPAEAGSCFLIVNSKIIEHFLRKRGKRKERKKKYIYIFIHVIKKLIESINDIGLNGKWSTPNIESQRRRSRSVDLYAERI